MNISAIYSNSVKYSSSSLSNSNVITFETKKDSADFLIRQNRDNKLQNNVSTFRGGVETEGNIIYIASVCHIY